MFMGIAELIVLSAALACLSCTAHAQGKPARKDALLYFVWPQDRATIKGGFWCRFGLRNMGVTHAGDDFQNSGHHHLLVDVNEPLDLNEPIPQDKTHLHFGAANRGAYRAAARQTHSPAGVRRCSALSVQPPGCFRQNYYQDQVD
jgi:hypothetical protein